jgi:hypothetical protein
MRSIKSYDYSFDQLLVLTLIPNSEFNNIKNKIEHLNKSSVIFKNKADLLSRIALIDKQKLKKCTICNNEFYKITDLKEHLILKCFHNKLKENDLKVIINNNTNTNDGDTNSNNGDSNTNTSNSNHNNIHSNNTVNNVTNIYLEVKAPLPFDENWDTSKIENIVKENIIFSKFMYSNLLTEILKNEINLNVIIEEDNDSGIVYKNDIDKYIKMKSEDIVDKTIQKLKEQLLTINTESANDYLEECIKSSKTNINKKYNNYVEKSDTKSVVSSLIKNIYNLKKDSALEICKKTEENNSNYKSNDNEDVVDNNLIGY